MCLPTQVKTKTDLKVGAQDSRHPQSRAVSPSARNKSIPEPAYDKLNRINWIQLNNSMAWKRTVSSREPVLGTGTKLLTSCP